MTKACAAVGPGDGGSVISHFDDLRAARLGRLVDQVARRIVALADSSAAEATRWGEPMWNDGSSLLDFCRQHLDGVDSDGYDELLHLADDWDVAARRDGRPFLPQPLWEIAIAWMEQPDFWANAGTRAPHFRRLVSAGRAGDPDARRKLEAVALVALAPAEEGPADG